MASTQCLDLSAQRLCHVTSEGRLTVKIFRVKPEYKINIIKSFWVSFFYIQRAYNEFAL